MLPSYLIGWTTPVARVVVGFVFGAVLAVLGGLLAAFFNVLSEFPFDLEFHRNIVLAGIGLGAGAGAYLPWMHSTPNPLLRLGVSFWCWLAAWQERISAIFLGRVSTQTTLESCSLLTLQSIWPPPAAE